MAELTSEGQNLANARPFGAPMIAKRRSSASLDIAGFRGKWRLYFQQIMYSHSGLNSDRREVPDEKPVCAAALNG